MFSGVHTLLKALDMLAVGANSMAYDALQQPDALGRAGESHGS